MPGKNKPKRLDRNNAWRVQRRKKKQRLLVGGNSRNRQPRPKHKGIVAAVIGKVTNKRVSRVVEEKVPKADKIVEDKE